MDSVSENRCAVRHGGFCCPHCALVGAVVQYKNSGLGGGTNMSRALKANLAAFLGYSIFGFSFLFSKLALEIASPLVLISVRFIVAFLALNLLRLGGRVRLALKGKPVHRLLLLGLVQPVLYFVLESYGIAMTSAALSGLMIGTAPVIGLIFGVLFLRERCTPLQAVCTVLSVVGVAMTGTGGFGGSSLTGFLLLLATAVCAALFPILSRSTAEHFSAYERTYVMIGLGSAAFTLGALFQNRENLWALAVPLMSGTFWTAVLYLALVSSVGAFLLINYSVNHISAGRTLIFSNCSTVMSILAGIFIMGDRFTPLQLLGMVVITLSIFGVSRKKSGEEADHALKS